MLIVLASSSFALADTVDLRSQTDNDGGSREISFCARPSPDKPGLPGHAFIAFSEEKDGKRSIRAIGHTAFSVGEALLSYSGIITGDGALVDEKYTSIKQHCLTLQVNRADYERAYGQALQPLKAMGIDLDETMPIQKNYSLAAEDCVGFLINQAKVFAPRLVIPSRKIGELPLRYVRRLIDAN